MFNVKKKLSKTKQSESRVSDLNLSPARHVNNPEICSKEHIFYLIHTEHHSAAAETFSFLCGILNSALWDLGQGSRRYRSTVLRFSFHFGQNILPAGSWQHIDFSHLHDFAILLLQSGCHSSLSFHHTTILPSNSSNDNYHRNGTFMKEAFLARIVNLILFIFVNISVSVSTCYYSYLFICEPGGRTLCFCSWLFFLMWLILTVLECIILTFRSWSSSNLNLSLSCFIFFFFCPPAFLDF